MMARADRRRLDSSRQQLELVWNLHLDLDHFRRGRRRGRFVVYIARWQLFGGPRVGDRGGGSEWLRCRRLRRRGSSTAASRSGGLFERAVATGGRCFYRRILKSTPGRARRDRRRRNRGSRAESSAVAARLAGPASSSSDAHRVKPGRPLSPGTGIFGCAGFDASFASRRRLNRPPRPRASRVASSAHAAVRAPLFAALAGGGRSTRLSTTDVSYLSLLFLLLVALASSFLRLAAAAAAARRLSTLLSRSRSPPIPSPRSRARCR